MRYIMVIAAAAAIFATGCQTRITATKHAETANPVYGQLNDNGTNVVRVVGYCITSGGWDATARSPSWCDEQLQGLQIIVATNGTVSLGLDAYHRDFSANSVTLMHNLVVDFAELAEKALAAYASCGATLATSGSKAAVQKAIASYITKGGSAGKARVSYDQSSGMLTITDGTTTEVCADGSCSPQ